MAVEETKVFQQIKYGSNPPCPHSRITRSRSSKEIRTVASRNIAGIIRDVLCSVPDGLQQKLLTGEDGDDNFITYCNWKEIE